MKPTPLGFRRMVLAAGLALAAAGCSQAPVPTPEVALFNTQSVLVGVSQWQSLAEDTAEDVADALDDTAALKAKPVYVEFADSVSPFGRAFYELLTTALADEGLRLASSPEGAVIVQYRAQLVERAGRVDLASFPGAWTVLAYGPWAVQSAARAISWGALADLHGSANAQGGAEVVVTTSVIDGDRVVMRRSDGYYIAAADIGRYRTFGPVADLAPARRIAGAPTVRGFNVVGQ